MVSSRVLLWSVVSGMSLISARYQNEGVREFIIADYSTPLCNLQGPPFAFQTPRAGEIPQKMTRLSPLKDVWEHSRPSVWPARVIA